MCLKLQLHYTDLSYTYDLYVCVWAYRSFWWSSLFVWMFSATVCSAIAISFCSLTLNGSRGDTADGHTYNMHVLTWYCCALCTTAYVVINGQWIGEFHSRRIPRHYYCWQPLYQGFPPARLSLPGWPHTRVNMAFHVQRNQPGGKGLAD